MFSYIHIINALKGDWKNTHWNGEKGHLWRWEQRRIRRGYNIFLCIHLNLFSLLWNGVHYIWAIKMGKLTGKVNWGSIMKDLKSFCLNQWTHGALDIFEQSSNSRLRREILWSCNYKSKFGFMYGKERYPRISLGKISTWVTASGAEE